MFYLFIFESIGTSEMALIALVALIVFGPRKLPEMARTIGKTMAEFRRSTDEFKQTWQQELMLEESKKETPLLTDLQTKETRDNEYSISRNCAPHIDEIGKPEIKELDKTALEQFLKKKSKSAEVPVITKKIGGKQEWL